ncbi:MAG: peptidoglycan-binding protein [Clostridia bacterium]|nr:peptidoglycan-binding protein [Clostridia bacterium]
MFRACRFIPLLFLLAVLTSAHAEEKILAPQWPVPEYASRLLEVASGEVGYTEEDHGRTKYGEWAGDPYCQWCAEFLCWCVDQVDRQFGTELLGSVYPRYSASNTGRSWFIRAGRYVIRRGQVEGWGYEWLKGQTSFLSSGDYIPQPGDWVFFTWTSDQNTDHVALVEYCSQNSITGEIMIHVIEGNKPSSVSRDTYSLHYSRILGYGTVHDVADITMQFGNQGEKVRQLQDKLAYLGLLDPAKADGRFGDATLNAVRAFQQGCGLRSSGIANLSTQLELDQQVRQKVNSDPEIWTVVDDEEEEMQNP